MNCQLKYLPAMIIATFCFMISCSVVASVQEDLDQEKLIVGEWHYDTTSIYGHDSNILKFAPDHTYVHQFDMWDNEPGYPNPHKSWTESGTWHIQNHTLTFISNSNNPEESSDANIVQITSNTLTLSDDTSKDGFTITYYRK